MNTNRILLALILLTVGMQAVILYKQFGGAPAKRQEVTDAPAHTMFDLSLIPHKGQPTAKLVLIEFSDYECPYCARHATTVAQEIEKVFVATGRVRTAFVNNPLPMHHNAKLLASAAICAGNQEQYWEMHDLLFDKAPKTEQEIFRISEGLRLNQEVFHQCIESAHAREPQRLEDDIKKAKDLQLRVTPVFGVGTIDDHGKATIKRFINGAVAFDVFERVLTEIESTNLKSTANVTGNP